MSEPRACPDCGTVELSRHSYEECCAILKERLTLATQRAEAAEAERDAYEMAHVFQAHAIASLEAERDALRKDVLDRVSDILHDALHDATATVAERDRLYDLCMESLHENFIDAALAVQPTTEGL